MASPAQPTPKQTAAGSKNFESPVALGLSEDDPFAPPAAGKNNAAAATSNTVAAASSKQQPNSSLAPTPIETKPSGSKGHRSSTSGGGSGHGGPFRHTIQVEYDDKNAKKSSEKKRERTGSQSHATPSGERRPSQGGQEPKIPPSPSVQSPAPSAYKGPQPASRTPSYSQPGPPKPAANPETPNISVSSPPPTPSFQPTHQKDKSSQSSLASNKKGHKKGKSSIDKLGLGKIFGNGASSSNTVPPVPQLNGSGTRLQFPNTESPSRSERSEQESNSSSVALGGSGSEKEQPPLPTDKGKKSRRNTLTVMVEPFIGTIRRKARGPNTPGGDGSSVASEASKSHTSTQNSQELLNSAAPSSTLSNAPPSSYPTTTAGASALEDESVFVQTQDLPPDAFAGMNASTSKARKVMQWFRTKSKGRESVGIEGGNGHGNGVGQEGEENTTPTRPKFAKNFSASSNTVNQVPASSTGLVEGAMSPQVVVTQAPQSASPKVGAPGHPVRSASTAHGEATTPSFVTRFRNSVTVGGLGSGGHGQQGGSKSASPHGALRIHHGAVDQTTITTRPPPEVMAHVRKVLEGMGMEIQLESEYKYRCIRMKKKKAAAAGTANGTTKANLAAVQMTGSAASNGVSIFVLF